MSGTLQITPFEERNSLVSWLFRGTGDRLVVVFSGIGRPRQRVQPYEFARSATADGTQSALYISDTARSWLNHPGIMDDIAALVTKAKASTGATRISTLGHSMGGFAAAIMAGALDADAAVCLSPQNSVHPDIAGDESRWMGFRDKISAFSVREVADYLNDSTIYTVLFGRRGKEEPQRDRFPIHDNMDFYVMTHTGHNTPKRLKTEGVLDTFVAAATQGRRRKIRKLMKNEFNSRRAEPRAPVPYCPSIARPTAPALENRPLD
jgi:pimeloyl-ACP methyl ester carboxylesterase